MSSTGVKYDKWFIAKVDRLTAEMTKVVEDMALEGEAMIKDAIETRGTGRTWAKTYYKRGIARSASIPGRVWTGDMLRAVDTEVVSTNEMVRGTFGWINKVEDYYRLQETGFTSNTGQEIAGMFAVHDAAAWAEKEFPRRAKKVIHGF